MKLATYMATHILTLIVFGLLLLICGCGSEEQTPTNGLASEPQAQVKQLAKAASTPAEATPGSHTMPEKTPTRPRFRDYTEGGKLRKKVKTDFFADNSYVIAYELSETLPELKLALLTPAPDQSGWQQIDIASLPYEGGMPVITDLFTHDVDGDQQTELLFIASWEVKHEALGINATSYRVYAYDNQLAADDGSLEPLTAIMNQFGSGMDGELETGPASFRYKDRASILAEL